MSLWDEFALEKPDRLNAIYAALKITLTGRGREMLGRYIPAIEQQDRFIEAVRDIQCKAAES